MVSEKIIPFFSKKFHVNCAIKLIKFNNILDWGLPIALN